MQQDELSHAEPPSAASPELALWKAVAARLVSDCISGGPGKYDRVAAQTFLFDARSNRDLQTICDLANVDKDALRRAVRARIGKPDIVDLDAIYHSRRRPRPESLGLPRSLVKTHWQQLTQIAEDFAA